MPIYASRPWRRFGQLTTDLLMLLWALAWWFTGEAIRAAVLSVAAPARETGVLATRTAAQFHSAAEQASVVPSIGGQLRKPFDAVSASLTDVISSANDQVASIERLASWAGWLVFLMPVTVLLAGWLPWRVRFILRATAARRFLDSSADLDLFALRAMASQPLHVLARISDDPVAAWRNGDATVISKLAETELRSTGLRLPEGLRPGAR